MGRNENEGGGGRVYKGRGVGVETGGALYPEGGKKREEGTEIIQLSMDPSPKRKKKNVISCLGWHKQNPSDHHEEPFQTCSKTKSTKGRIPQENKKGENDLRPNYV